MRNYFWTLGIFCVLYYLILAIYSRRLRSTFAVFWLLTGGAHLFLGCVPFPAYVKILLGWICFGLWSIFLVMEIQICKGMYSKAEDGAQWIIVLGAQVRGKKITDSLRRRLDTVVCYLKKNKETKVIVSGGQGAGEEITEAEAMAEYLIKQGISKDRIRMEDQSTSTRENLRFSRKFLKADQETVGIVTNNFHSYRSKLLAKEEGYDHVFSLSASSNYVFQLNYLVREFFAVMAMKLRKSKIKEY